MPVIPVKGKEVLQVKEKDLILLCLDMEEGSEELLRRGALYAKRLNQPLSLLYVLLSSGIQDEVSALKSLEELAVSVPEAADATAVVRRGCVEEEILDYVREESVELVILGHRHKAKRERVHVGSTVGTVISLAPGAVLVLALGGKV